MLITKLFHFVKRLRNRHFFVIDFVMIVFTPLLALFLRTEGNINFEYSAKALIYYTIIFSGIKIFLYKYLGLYRHLWRHASIDELSDLIVTGAVSIIIQAFAYYILRYIPLFSINLLPLLFPFYEGFFAITGISSVRFSIRLLERSHEKKRNRNSNLEPVIIVGAGEAGVAIIKEIHRHPKLGMNPIGYVDDNPEKINRYISSIKVLGNTDALQSIILKYKIKKVIIAIPSAPGKVIRRINDLCTAAGAEVLTVPGIFEILNGDVSINKLRKVQVEDLLRREPIITHTDKVRQFLQNKRILITGAGGSIGSELCRQILSFNPAELIIMGHGENSIFEIKQELKSGIREKKLNAVVPTQIQSVIMDLRFKERLKSIFTVYSPEVIFHAAAHKHVPLMEENSQEAITNNILGTKNLIDLSIEFDVDRFISISTDKAVNPSSIMGATKRITEMLVLDAARKTKRYYSAVRFGNVLGSRGSVLRTFQKQLASGGPLTVTHPDITRYFMTIPEAVQLVLQASVSGVGGDIFVLDMGDPVKIMDLAKDVIRLAGLKEGVDIDILCTGLRKGEKLYEELFITGEKYEPTEHEKILIARNASNFISGNLDKLLLDLSDNLNGLTKMEIIHYLKCLIPEFSPADKLC